MSVSKPQDLKLIVYPMSTDDESSSFAYTLYYASGQEDKVYVEAFDSCQYNKTIERSI